MKQFAAAEWKRARGALATAEALVAIDRNSTAARAALHRDLVYTGVFAKEVGIAYDFLDAIRQTCSEISSLETSLNSE